MISVSLAPLGLKHSAKFTLIEVTCTIRFMRIELFSFETIVAVMSERFGFISGRSNSLALNGAV